MKKLFTILTVVALTTTISFAQFSAKAGLNMANIVTNNTDSSQPKLSVALDDADNGMKLGIIIGCGYAMELSDAMSLDISVAFKQSGTKQTEDFTGGSSTMTYALNYLDISPNLAFNVSDAMALSFGPYLAFAISGKTTGETIITNGPTTSTSESIEFGEATLEGELEGTGPDGISAMDFGINIGASFSINDAMSISAGYALGLTDLYSADSDLEEFAKSLGEDLPSLKNSGIFLTFGYTFGG